MDKAHYNISLSNKARAQEKAIVDTARIEHWMRIADQLQDDFERLYEAAAAGKDISLSNSRGDTIILRPAPSQQHSQQEKG